jgi:hypothetical protein
MSWMANLKMMVQIMPSVIFKFPSTISSAPIETSLTPFDAMKSRALLTLAIYMLKISLLPHKETIYASLPCGIAFFHDLAWAEFPRR